MRQTLSKKIIRSLVTVLLIITCTACKASSTITNEDYLNDLAYKSGIDLSRDINSSFDSLETWEVVEKEDINNLDEQLTYDFLSKTIGNLINEDNAFEYLKENNLIKKNTDKDDLVDEESKNKIIDKAVYIINNPEIEENNYIDEKDVDHINDYKLIENKLETDKEYEEGDIVYLENDDIYKKVVGIIDNKYILEDAGIEEIADNFEFSGSEYIDFNEAEVIPYAYETYESNYSNNNYELLASNRKKFSLEGFSVSYSINSSGIDARISKSIKDNFTLFFDIDLSNVKPVYKWNYQDGDVKESFFKVNYKLTNEIGVSCGKYVRYYLDFRELDSSSFLSSLKSSIKPKEDEVECNIPICTIKTPIPNVPSATLNIEVLAKIYVSGKVEIVFYNNGAVGFESKNGKLRVINDTQKDNDFIIGASARAVAGLNFNIEAASKRLMDIELDAGVRAAVTSTIHLYDEDGNKKEVESDIPYAVLEEVSKENNDVKVCGDLSLNWVLDLEINTSKALLHKYGLTYKKEILNSNDQVFSNLTHIENWMFVKNCTRKNRPTTKTTKTTKLNSNKIELIKYSAVVVVNESYKIEISSIPEGYTSEDLVFNSTDSSIVSVDTNGIVKAIKIGSCKVDIKTKDDKYKASINILVSTG